jgi:hypothetical protein
VPRSRGAALGVECDAPLLAQGDDALLAVLAEGQLDRGG